MPSLKSEDYIHGGVQKDHYNASEIERCNCPYCDTNEFEVLSAERGLGIVKCNSCGLIYTNPRSSDSERNYFENTETFFEEARLIFSGKKSHHRDKNYEFELRKIKKVKPHGKLLDVGTYMGFFLRKAREFGYETEGVEPSPSVSLIAQKEFRLNVHNAFLENANLRRGSYDIITLIDVFEHVKNPKVMLLKCHELLKDDGIMAIKIPNGEYNHLKQKLGSLFGQEVRTDIWNAREHVVHYNQKTFIKMVASAGFKIDSFFVPIPIHSPVWHYFVGHYYQYPSPFILDWKRVLLRNFFYWTGRLEKLLGLPVRFGPDLMFIIKKV